MNETPIQARILPASLVLSCCLCSAVAAQSLPFYDGFDDGDYAGWTVTDDVEPQSGPSEWVVEGGVLMQRSNIWSYPTEAQETRYHLGTHITTGDAGWADYALNAVVRSADNDGLGLIVRYQDARNYYRLLLMNDPAWSGRDSAGTFYDSVSATVEPQVYEEPSVDITYPVREFRAPYVQRPTQTSIEVAWRTVASEVGTVKYGLSKGVLDEEVAETEAHQKHHVALTGLLPSTRYYYEVYSGGAEVQAETDFRTARRPEETRFSFLVLGDSGVDTPTQYAVGAEMRKSMNAGEVDFVLHVGDVHQGIGDDYDDIYFKPYRDVIKNVNVFTALGNHDVITDNGAVYLDDFYLPRNNPDSTERYYSFRWANAYFICLDTNSDYAPGSPQYAFLINALADTLRTSATWTFVYAHHPPYSEYWTDYYGEQAVREYLMPVYEQYDVDLVMNGHTHSYERGEKEHVHYLISGGGGGVLDDYFIDHNHITFSDGVHHFTRIDVDGDELHVSAIDFQGNEVDHFTINKGSSVTVEEPERIPGAFALEQNYPNPFNPATTIRYAVPEQARVSLVLYDLTGRALMTLVDREQPAGTYAVTLDAQALASGAYVYTLRAGALVQSRRLTVVQ